MRKFGGIRHFMPITFATFGLGYLAILGVPPFAGFYSKDKIIETAFYAGGVKGILIGSVALFGAALTAFYMSRVMILTFTGTPRYDINHPPHESSFLMLLPMGILAIGSVTSGFLLARGEALVHWLEPLFEAHEGHGTEILPPVVISLMALAVVIIGAAFAWFKYGRGIVADTAPTDVSIFTRIARRDLLQDDFNESVFMRPGQALTRLIVKTDDVVVDGTVRGVASATLGSGSALRSTQTGFVRSYAALIVIGAIALIAAIWAVTL
jgi:NADH-quinone oxidoreductase subunit L